MNIEVNINLCRVCMKSETGSSVLNDENLQSKFEFVTHLRVKKGDNLPTIICEKCILRLNLSYKFIQSAQEAEKNLRTFLDKINNDFKLVAKNSPIASDEADDVDCVLELLSGTNVQDTSSETLKGPKEDDKNCENSKIYDSDGEELRTVEEIYTLKAVNSNTTDDDESRSIEAQHKKQSVHYIDLNEENSQLIEYKDLEEVAVTEQENSKLSGELKDEPPNNDVFFEEYVTLLEDETSTMDILYEDNDNVFQTDDVQKPVDISNVDKTELKDSSVIPKEQDEVVIKVKRKMSGTLRKLSNSVAESTRFYCSKCNRDFSTKTNLTRHMQLHEGKRPYQCKICLKEFSQNGTLKQHMYIHTGEKPHVCSVCNRGFTQAKSLVFHMRRHTGYKPYHCDYCLSPFRQKHALKVHILKHHTDIGVRESSCKICKKTMNGHEELRSHMKKHLNNHTTIIMDSSDIMQASEHTELSGKPILLTDETTFDVESSTHVIDIMAASTTEPSRAKRYQCRTCFKCFAIKKNLIRHLSFHDIPASSMQQCKTCELVFDSNYALKVHRVREHMDTNINLNECDECQVKFQNASELSVHMQFAHTFTCSQCPELTFTTKKHLCDHFLEHNISKIEADE